MSNMLRATWTAAAVLDFPALDMQYHNHWSLALGAVNPAMFYILQGMAT